MADEIEEKEEQSENFWKQILNEVSTQSSRRLCANKTLLILGDNGSGKSQLVSKLRSFGGKDGELKKAGGLQYTVIDVQHEDENIKLGTWLLNGDSFYSNLLQYVVTKDTVKNLTVLLVADMSKPWSITETLEHWHQKLHSHLNSLHLSAKELNEMERKLEKAFHDYNKEIEGGEEKIVVADTENETQELGENVLSNNIGIPIIVVITKSDNIAALEKENDYHEEHFDFMQKHIRKFCLKTGAALMYTSSKEGTNTSLLYKYLNYLIYGIKFPIFPQLVEKETIFIPTGWDNEKKIAIIDEHIKTFSSEDPYKDHIIKPPLTKPANQEKEIVAEDEQLFLEAQLQTLSKAPATAPAMARPPQGGEHRVSPRGTNVSPGQRPGARMMTPQAKGKMETAKVSGENSSETVLANFFNSLLSKNTTGKMNKNSGNPVTNRSDVQAELERMSKKTPAAAKKE